MNSYTYTLSYNFDGDRHWIMSMQGVVFEEVYARACLFRPDKINWRIVRSDGVQIAHHDVIDVNADLWKRMRVNVLQAEHNAKIVARIERATEIEARTQWEEVEDAVFEVYRDHVISWMSRRANTSWLHNAIAQVVLS